MISSFCYQVEKSTDDCRIVNHVARQDQSLLATGGAALLRRGSTKGDNAVGGMRRRPSAVGQGLRLSLNI